MQKHKLWYKQATPTALNECLLSHTFFQQTEHWKYIAGVYTLLNKLQCWNKKDRGNGKLSSVTYKVFSNLFSSQYPQVVAALEELGLLQVVRTSTRKSNTCQGKCYEYLLLTKCHELLASTDKQTLYLLHNDKQTIRRNQHAISKRGYNQKVYGDVRDNLKSTIDKMSYNQEQVTNVCETFLPEKKAFAYSMLVSITRKDYDDMKHNEKDNRIPNPYAQLPSDIKACLRVNDKPLQMTIDIRSCYPSLWAAHVWRHIPLEMLKSAEMFDLLTTEREHYESIFLNKDIDPKDYLSKLLRIDRQDIKDVLIQYYNGKGFNKQGIFSKKGKNNPFRKYDEWVSSTFPLLYAEWVETDVSQTGNEIGKHFETKLMLDKSIFEKAATLHVEIGYEYDGMSLFADNKAQCAILLDVIKAKCMEVLGIQLVFKEKNVQTYYDYMREGYIQQREEALAENDKKLASMRGRCWHNKNWKPYYNIQEKSAGIIKEILAVTQ